MKTNKIFDCLFVRLFLASLLIFVFTESGHGQSGDKVLSKSIPVERMEQVYEEVKTPFKYGIVIRGEEGQLVDCASIFKKNNQFKIEKLS